MGKKIAGIFFIYFLSGATLAANVALTCGDYLVLTETAVQHREAKISKTKSKLYLAEDEYLSSKEKNKIRKMIDQVYALPSQGKSHFVAMAQLECRQWQK